MSEDRRAIPSVELLHECFDYDPETGVLAWKKRPPQHFATTTMWKRWNTRYAGKPAGLINHNGYWLVAIDDRKYLAHRAIWKMTTGKEPPLIIDHKDGNPANNRWSNLRAATALEQQWNRRLGKTNSSGFKGVCRHRSKWIAQIRVNGANRYRGVYETPEQAAAAYEAAARELHGEFYAARG